jgi:predicted ArsR family transcriptional regulator
VIIDRVAFLRRRRLTAPGPLATQAWQALASLADPRRREVYEHVAHSDGPVTRDEVGEALGISRSLAAFHLDKLAGSGLLDVSFARPPGRPAGRGAGRPSKRYQLSDVDLGISLPPRRYDIVGRILARTLGAGHPADLQQRAWQVAAEEGRRLAHSHLEDATGPVAVAAAVEQAMADCGYQPVPDGTRILVRNCPFLAVADAMPDAVCSVNHGFLTGLLEGLGAAGEMRVERVAHRPGGCCVEIGGTAPEAATA